MIKVRASLHRCSKLKGGPKPFRKSNWKKQIRYFRCTRDYRQDGTWVEAEKWGVGITRRRATFGVAGLGERRRLAGTMCVICGGGYMRSLGERRRLAGTSSMSASTTYVDSYTIGRKERQEAVSLV